MPRLHPNPRQSRLMTANPGPETSSDRQARADAWVALIKAGMRGELDLLADNLTIKDTPQ
jgi:hypothetical protein